MGCRSPINRPRSGLHQLQPPPSLGWWWCGGGGCLGGGGCARRTTALNCVVVVWAGGCQTQASDSARRLASTPPRTPRQGPAFMEASLTAPIAQSGPGQSPGNFSFNSLITLGERSPAANTHANSHGSHSRRRCHNSNNSIGMGPCIFQAEGKNEVTPTMEGVERGVSLSLNGRL